MKVNAHQLAGQLKQNLASVYLVTGDEPLLVQEACADIRTAALNAGFSERKVFHGDPQVDWNAILDEARALSLFAERQRIEVRLPSDKLGQQGRQALENYLKDPSPDAILIIAGPRLDGAELKRAWYKKLQKDAVHVQIWPIDSDRFPGWLQQRAQTLGLTLSKDAVAVLSDRVEGNLLAAHQELERLALTSDKRSLDGDDVAHSVLDNSRFNAFELAAEAMTGNTAHALKMLGRIQLEGTNPLPVLAPFSRDLKHAFNLQHAMQQGTAPKDYFRTHWIRQRGQMQAIETTARRLTGDRLRTALGLSECVDQAVKGARKDRTPWQYLEALVVALRP